MPAACLAPDERGKTQEIAAHSHITKSAYRVARFRADHLAGFEVQPAQMGERAWDAMIDAGQQFEAAGNAFTMSDLHRGLWRPVFCGGAMERHPEYATLWAMFSIHRPRVPVWLTRRVRAFVAALPHRRTDTMVRADNIGALGWARLIGLREECVLRAACEDGGDMVVMVRPFAAGGRNG